MTTRWSLWVDESGKFASVAQLVVVAGLLLEARSSLRPHVIRALIEREIPLLPWPIHATLLNQPAYVAIAVRMRATGSTEGDPLIKLAQEAWSLMTEADTTRARLVASAVRNGEVESEYAEVSALSHVLWQRDRLLAERLMAYPRRAAAVLNTLLTRHGEPLDPMRPALVTASETVVGDAIPVTAGSDRYLVLLAHLLERVVQTLRENGGEHEVTLWVSRRDVADSRFPAPVRLSVPHLITVIGSISALNSGVRLIPGGVGSIWDDPNGAGFVLADLAANAARREMYSARTPIREVENNLAQRFGASVRTPARGLSHCSASGEAGLLIRESQGGKAGDPAALLPYVFPRRLWACEQAWRWAERYLAK